jgi:hypothetical protein
MAKYLRFSIVGYAEVPVDEVTFTTSHGSAADPAVIEELSAEDLIDNINNGDLDFDWLAFYQEDKIANLSVEEIEVVEKK